MDLPPQCASCLQAFGKGRKHDVVINDQTATVNDTKFLLPLTRGLQPCKVCTKCCNRNSELVNVRHGALAIKNLNLKSGRTEN